jgi:hypothetical protein
VHEKASLEALYRTEKEFASLRVEGDIALNVGKANYAARLLFMASSSGQFRLGLLSQQGEVGAEIVCDGTSLRFADFLHECHYDALCDSKGIKAVLGVQLSASELVRTLAGGTPLPISSGKLEEVARSGEITRVVLSNPSRVLSVEYTTVENRALVRTAEYGDGVKVAAKIAYSEHLSDGGVPRETLIESGTVAITWLLDWNASSFSSDAPKAGAFAFPPGAHRKCAAAAPLVRGAMIGRQ